jgi:hypothetical protein
MSHAQQPSSFQSRQRRTTRQSAFWAGAWILATALFAFGPESLWPGQLWLTIAVAVLSLGVGIGALFHWRNALNNADDLHRKVILEAMAIALGVGMVVGTIYPMMESHELAPFDDDMTELVLVMGLTFLTSMILGLRRYR